MIPAKISVGKPLCTLQNKIYNAVTFPTIFYRWTYAWSQTTSWYTTTIWPTTTTIWYESQPFSKPWNGQTTRTNAAWTDGKSCTMVITWVRNENISRHTIELTDVSAAQENWLNHMITLVDCFHHDQILITTIFAKTGWHVFTFLYYMSILV